MKIKLIGHLFFISIIAAKIVGTLCRVPIIASAYCLSYSSPSPATHTHSISQRLGSIAVRLVILRTHDQNTPSGHIFIPPFVYNPGPIASHGVGGSSLE